MDTQNYIVVLDKELNFCRLFRSDSEDIPAGEILWNGDGLRHGYDAMIRLNKERKPVQSYFVCAATRRGRVTYSVKKSDPGEGYEILCIKNEFKLAAQEVKSLRAKAEQEREKMFGLMKRVGISSKRIPKFTEKDLRYIDWLHETGKIAA